MYVESLMLTLSIIALTVPVGLVVRIGARNRRGRARQAALQVFDEMIAEQ